MPNHSQKGVSLIITFFITIIILFVVLAISTILYSQIKVIRNIGNSVVAFYAADSGVEKVLYYDKKVFPAVEGEPEGQATGKPERGLCYMCDSPKRSCPESDAISSVNCSCETLQPLDTELNGCKKNQCDNCEVKFSTIFDGKSYNVITRVYEGCEADDSDCTPDNPNTYFTIKSFGSYENVKRAVELKTKETGTNTDCTISIDANNTSATNSTNPSTPYCIAYTDILFITTHITDTKGQIDANNVTAALTNLDPPIFPPYELSLNGPVSGDTQDGTWQYSWSPASTDPSGRYNVTIKAYEEGNESCSATISVEATVAELCP